MFNISKGLDLACLALSAPRSIALNNPVAGLVFTPLIMARWFSGTCKKTETDELQYNPTINTAHTTFIGYIDKQYYIDMNLDFLKRYGNNFYMPQTNTFYIMDEDIKWNVTPSVGMPVLDTIYAPITVYPLSLYDVYKIPASAYMIGYEDFVYDGYLYIAIIHKKQ